jgi:hypothetical protein
MWITMWTSVNYPSDIRRASGRLPAVDRLKNWRLRRSLAGAERVLARLGLEAPHHSPAELALLRPIAEALVADLNRTLGWTEARANDFIGSVIRTTFFGDDPEWVGLNFAENVQQDMRDSFVDMTWQAFTRHPTHPLWLRQNPANLWWTCLQAETRISRLGQLAT